MFHVARTLRISPVLRGVPDDVDQRPVVHLGVDHVTVAAAAADGDGDDVGDDDDDDLDALGSRRPGLYPCSAPRFHETAELVTFRRLKICIK